MTRHDIPGLPLRDPGSERADDSQEAVAGDGGEGHHAGHHAEDWQDRGLLGDHQTTFSLPV